MVNCWKTFGVRRLVAALVVTPVSDFDYQSGDKSPHSKRPLVFGGMVGGGKTATCWSPLLETPGPSGIRDHHFLLADIPDLVRTVIRQRYHSGSIAGKAGKSHRRCPVIERREPGGKAGSKLPNLNPACATRREKTI